MVETDKEKHERHNQEVLIDFLLKYASIGDLRQIKNLIDYKRLDINSTKYGLTALSVCAAKCGDLEVIKYLLSKGSQIRDSHLHAIRAGNTEATELLISHISKNDRNLETYPTKDSVIFAPYMTPLMLAAICGHRSIIELLMSRGHTIPIPHMSDCDCDDCTVSSTGFSSQSQRNLDIYRAICNPEYIAINSSDPIIKALRLENETKLAIEKSHYYSHHYSDMFKKMEDYVTDLIDVTRDPEEVKVLLKQKGAKSQTNSHIKYPALQNAVDQRWVNFIGSKQIENLRSHLWLGENKTWFRSGIDGFGMKFIKSLFMLFGQLFFSIKFIVRQKKHITAQTRYLCRLFNESIFLLILLFYLTENPNDISFSMNIVYKISIIVWTIGFMVNVTKKFAIFGPHKTCYYFGNVFEIIVVMQLVIIIIMIFTCESKIVCNDNECVDGKLSPEESVLSSYCGLSHILLGMLLKVIFAKLIGISALRAYKGTHEHAVIHLFLLSFCLISIFYPILADILVRISHISHFKFLESTNGSLVSENTEPMFLFVIINFLIGFFFEISKGPEKISDKFWCYHWTTRLVYELHGACELPVPFNILEIHRVVYIVMKRAIFEDKPTQQEIEQYKQIKSLVFARYDCKKYLTSRH